jgi:hypothetical protein
MGALKSKLASIFKASSTRKAHNTAEKRAKAQNYINMLERINKAPKGLNWLRKGYYGVKELFNKKSLTNRIASAKSKGILARNRAAQITGLSRSPVKPLGGFGAYAILGSARSGRSRSTRSGRSRSTRSGRSRSMRSGRSRSTRSGRSRSASPVSPFRSRMSSRY